MNLLKKYHVLTIIFSIVFSVSFSQSSQLLAQQNSNSNQENFTSDVEKEIDIPFFQGRKIYWYDSLKLLRQDLNLEDLEKSKQPQYIRVWTDKSAIDAWKDGIGDYHCVVTSFCKSYNEKKKLEDILMTSSEDFESFSKASERIGLVVNALEEKTNRWLELADFA